ncbi:MAG: glycosyltransferase family 4 protein [Actinomycetota bacterium]
MAPPWYEVPPGRYGGIEWICWGLAEGLRLRGHEVVLVAAGSNRTSAQFIQTYAEPPSSRVGDALPEVVHAAEAHAALSRLDLDVVHDHSVAGPLLAPSRVAPTMVTVHGPIRSEFLRMYGALGEAISLVAISEAQRAQAPELRWVGVVYNGIPVRDYPYRERKEDFALFLGRLNPEKGPHVAIEACRRARVPLVLAGRCNEPGERAYYEQAIRPLLGDDTVWAGEVDLETKKDLLSRARCLVFPICWEEPFGLVMVEAMACGTPVIALRRGSVPEVVEQGVTGILAEDVTGLASGIARASNIRPRACRERAAARFDVDVMVGGYEAIYRRALDRPGALMSPGEGASRPGSDVLSRHGDR